MLRVHCMRTACACACACACARHGALYVMVDTWAKVDAHALTLSLALTLALALGLAVSLAVVLTPNAKSPILTLAQSDCCRQFTDLLTHSLTHSAHLLT